MTRFLRISILLSFFVLFWSCTEDSPIVNDDSEISSDNSGSLEKYGIANYSVTITNLTPATQPGASQPLSPPVLATHPRFIHVFRVGKYASSELAQVAEDAFSDPLVAKLSDAHFVYDVQQGDGVILPGESTTINISAPLGFRKLSIVSMLVNTNDAFAGLDGFQMPFRGSKTVYLKAYDAGSERNTESFDHIPGPCCGNPFMRVPTHERIRKHRGIKGVGDLDRAIYGWKGRVAKVTITRIN